MSRPNDPILVRISQGHLHLRRDTCEALGIVPGELLGPNMHQLAVREDHDRNKDDRKRRAGQ